MSKKNVISEMHGKCSMILIDRENTVKQNYFLKDRTVVGKIFWQGRPARAPVQRDSKCFV